MLYERFRHFNGDTSKGLVFLCCELIEEGVRIGRELLEVMSRDKRQPLPFSKLNIGFKCGGSDGLSGITANPLAGLLTDRIVG